MAVAANELGVLGDGGCWEVAVSNYERVTMSHLAQNREKLWRQDRRNTLKHDVLPL